MSLKRAARNARRASGYRSVGSDTVTLTKIEDVCSFEVNYRSPPIPCPEARSGTATVTSIDRDAGTITFEEDDDAPR